MLNSCPECREICRAFLFHTYFTQCQAYCKVFYKKLLTYVNFTNVKLYVWVMEAKKLKKLVDDKGIKQVWLASKIGVTRSMVNQWISGKSVIPVKHHEQLAKLLS